MPVGADFELVRLLHRVADVERVFSLVGPVDVYIDRLSLRKGHGVGIAPAEFFRDGKRCPC